MLWKKETLRPDALYTNIFAPNTQQWDSTLNSFLQTIDQTPHPQKSNTIALERRNEGNGEFRLCTPFKAMESYSDSLRFAEPRSENISLAYANRAACFLQLKMYDECLIDIELAKQSDYPKHLMSKLDQRKAKCLKEMQEYPQHREKLSIEPNEMFPSLSNMVQAQRNKEKGDYSLVAKTDIDVGQLIAIEDPFCAFVRNKFGIQCNICSKEFCNLVPCKKCAVAMFCPECQGHFLHEYECGLNFCGESNFNSITMKAVRSTLLAVKLFPTVDELMSFVEKVLKTNELPESMLDDRSIYQAFFNSPCKLYDSSLAQMKTHIYSTYKTLLRIPHVNEMFKTTKHRRFLMHLIGHHRMLPQFGAGMYIDEMSSQNPTGFSAIVSPVMMSYFKRSCNLNVIKYICGGRIIFFSSKPIKKGENLFILYTPRWIESTKERKKILLDMFKIKCECSRCQGKIASPAQRQQMVSDPAYRFINSNMKNHFPSQFNGDQLKSLMDACLTILRRYSQMDWSDEYAHVLQLYHNMYQVQLRSGGRDLNHPLFHKLLSNCIDYI